MPPWGNGAGWADDKVGMRRRIVLWRGANKDLGLAVFDLVALDQNMALTKVFVKIQIKSLYIYIFMNVLFKTNW